MTRPQAQAQVRQARVRLEDAARWYGLWRRDGPAPVEWRDFKRALAAYTRAIRRQEREK